MKDCRICRADAEGRKWTMDVLVGKKSVHEMAKYFGVTEEEVWQHIDHINPEELKMKVRKETGSEKVMEKLESMIDILSEKVDELMFIWNPDSQRISDLTKLVKELRGALMDYAEIIGEIQRGQVVVQVQQVEHQIEQIIDILMSEVCDSCRERVLQRLEEMKIA